MADKKEKVEVKVGSETLIVESTVTSSISPVTSDFGRADLNQLRDAVNELIARG
jgi:hypothetical protein